MRRYWFWVAVLFLAISSSVRADNVSFSTFVSSVAINAVEGGNNSTIAFNYNGTSFVGSVYFDNQLYSSNLIGGCVATFGTPHGTRTSAGVQSSNLVVEVVVGTSLHQASLSLLHIYE